MSSLLSYDILLYILSFLVDDTKVLYQLALANKEFNDAASHALYTQVTLSPPFQSYTLNLKDNGLPTGPSQFMSAILPRHSSSVRYLRISGFLSTRPPPKNELHRVLHQAIESFTQLQSVSFLPIVYHEDIFVQPLKILRQRPTIEELAVNASCYDAFEGFNSKPSSGLATLNEEEAEEEEPAITKIELLTSFRNLKKLALHDPSRAILQALVPGWLNALSGTLTHLHLIGNCGSITPGVLRSAIPHLERIRSLTIGLSYSLTDQDVFTALSQLPNLQALCINYYLQNTSPARFAPLRQLQSLTVCYGRPETRRERDSLCKWVRKAVYASPLERLYLEDDSDEGLEYGANLSFEPLIRHLIAVHASRLKVLDMRTSYVGVAGFRMLCLECRALEEMALAVDRNTLDLFMDCGSDLTTLHTATFIIYNSKRAKRDIDDELAYGIITSAPKLRRLTVNDRKWEGSWICNEDGVAEFRVTRTK